MERNYRVFKVWQPKSGALEELEPIYTAVPVEYNEFRYLWRTFVHGMLRRVGDNDPVVDLYAPFDDVEGEFEYAPWTHEYQHLLAELKLSRLVAISSKAIQFTGFEPQRCTIYCSTRTLNGEEIATTPLSAAMDCPVWQLYALFPDYMLFEKDSDVPITNIQASISQINHAELDLRPWTAQYSWLRQQIAEQN